MPIPPPANIPSSAQGVISNLYAEIDWAKLRVITRDPLRLEPSADSPAAANSAVAKCVGAYNDAAETATIDGQDERYIRESAVNAYRDALPPLVGLDNIRNFIACIAQGMLIQVIGPEDGARLLYAAQVATAAHRPRPHRPNTRRPEVQSPASGPSGSQTHPVTHSGSEG